MIRPEEAAREISRIEKQIEGMVNQIQFLELGSKAHQDAVLQIKVWRDRINEIEERM